MLTLPVWAQNKIVTRTPPSKKVVIEADGPFSEGLAHVSNYNRPNSGFIDKTGKLVIPITKPADSFSEGFAKVEGLGYIDKSGKVVIKPH